MQVLEVCQEEVTINDERGRNAMVSINVNGGSLDLFVTANGDGTVTLAVTPGRESAVYVTGHDVGCRVLDPVVEVKTLTSLAGTPAGSHTSIRFDRRGRSAGEAAWQAQERACAAGACNCPPMTCPRDLS